MVLNVHRNHKAYLGRGERGKGVEVGEGGDYVSIATLATRMTPAAMTPALRWAAM